MPPAGWHVSGCDIKGFEQWTSNHSFCEELVWAQRVVNIDVEPSASDKHQQLGKRNMKFPGMICSETIHQEGPSSSAGASLFPN